jgi:hypothetical protein
MYSVPLRRTLKGYRKLRVGDDRVVMRTEGDDFLILGICHRKDDCERIEWRGQECCPTRRRLFISRARSQPGAGSHTCSLRK